MLSHPARSSMQQPVLTRCCATERLRSGCVESRRQEEIMAAYENLPFRGGPLLLPNGIVVSEDLWRCQLEMESSLDKNFSLEEWLKRKVETDGSAKQKRDLADLVSRFDDWERNSVDDALGLPAEISVMEHQVEEIMVYRGLPTDIVVPEDEDEDDSEEAIAM